MPFYHFHGGNAPRIELALELGAGSFSAPAGPRAYAPDMTRWVRPPWGPFRMHRPRTSTGEGVRGRAGRGDSAIVSQATLCDACPAPNHANSLSHPGTPTPTIKMSKPRHPQARCAGPGRRAALFCLFCSGFSGTFPGLFMETQTSSPSVLFSTRQGMTTVGPAHGHPYT